MGTAGRLSPKSRAASTPFMRGISKSRIIKSGLQRGRLLNCVKAVKGFAANLKLMMRVHDKTHQLADVRNVVNYEDSFCQGHAHRQVMANCRAPAEQQTGPFLAGSIYGTLGNFATVNLLKQIHNQLSLSPSRYRLAPSRRRLRLR
jgi:hypothetical protein